MSDIKRQIFFSYYKRLESLTFLLTIILFVLHIGSSVTYLVNSKNQRLLRSVEVVFFLNNFTRVIEFIVVLPSFLTDSFSRLGFCLTRPMTTVTTTGTCADGDNNTQNHSERGLCPGCNPVGRPNQVVHGYLQSSPLTGLEKVGTFTLWPESEGDSVCYSLRGVILSSSLRSHTGERGCSVEERCSFKPYTRRLRSCDVSLNLVLGLPR